ncbi:MAG: DUF305 domain-containing protein [Pseudomonadota bacterium]
MTVAGLVSVSLAAGCSTAQEAQEAPAIIQPGAPGMAGVTLSAEEASQIARNSYSIDDVRFMQDMIPHHQQAVEMANLVEARTNTETTIDIAGRILGSQTDEIEFMTGWLSDRGETAPKVGAHAGMDHGAGDHSAHDHATHMSHEMMGMATPEQMTALAAAEGADFDEMFLTLMIRHHEGAVDMVDDLLSQRGSAYDPVLFEFVNGIVNDQTSEIERMDELLAGLSTDPRVGLAAGFRDSGEAILNLTKVASLPKPAGFFDPDNPAGVPPIIEPDPEEDDAEAEMADDTGHEGHGDMDMADKGAGEGEDEGEDAGEMVMAAAESEADPDARDDGQSNEETQWGTRSPQLSFSNTDMAFSGDMLIVGNYHGFNIYDIASDGPPELISSVVCPGGQGDVSIAGDLLIMSVEQTRGRVDCGRQGVSEDVSEERFRGLRIFDISDPRLPVQVGQVQTCRGSHTHSIVSGPGAEGKIIVYNSGTSSIRDGDELEGCVGAVAGDNRTALFRIDVIEIPVDAPGEARIVDSPAVFADDETGQLSGLWQGGDHGEDTQRSARTDHCHDITVFPEKQIAAGACSGNGVIFDISDPYAPKRIDAVVDQKFAYWHSATFNNDGTKVLFTDEWGGGSRPRCRASDPSDWGANAIYDIVDGKLEFRSYYKIPAPQSDKENCVAHNGAIVPVPGRDIFVQAWYQGGLSLIDFTDSANPQEIGYFDRGPLHPDRLVLGGYWSTYWYGGRIYGTAISRGLDVFTLAPSDMMSEAEIGAAEVANQGELFNPQQQFMVTWPEGSPDVAQAYLDQLSRSGGLDEASVGDAEGLLASAGDALGNGGDAGLAADLAAFAGDLETQSPEDADTARLAAFQTELDALSERLQ